MGFLLRGLVGVGPPLRLADFGPVPRFVRAWRLTVLYDIFYRLMQGRIVGEAIEHLHGFLRAHTQASTVPTDFQS